MQARKLSRKQFLRATAITAVGVAAASCAQPTPQIIEKEVPVEQVVKETVVVEKQVPVEKIVKETIIVEREVPVEKIQVVPGEMPSKYSEAPMLKALVDAGQLPPVEERLPENPLVLPVADSLGQYGGTWRRAYKGVSDRWGPDKVIAEYLLDWRMPEGGSISIVPQVAEKFDQNDTATEYTFYFRKGMKWSDGQPLTTEDVRFWYEDLFMDESIGPGLGIQNDRLSPGGEPMKVEIIDDYTFKLIFAAPNPLLPIAVPSGAIGTHYGARSPDFTAPSHFMKQYHPKYASQADIDAALKKYNLATWDALLTNESPASHWFWNPEVPTIHAWLNKVAPPAERILFERNPYYFAVDSTGKQLPYIDNITHDLFDNVEVFNFKIINGEIDCQQRHTDVANFTLYKENEEKGQYRVLIWREAKTDALHPNIAYDKDPVLQSIMDDVRFRQALSVALDRDKINDLAYAGLGESRQACPVSGSPQFSADWETYYTQYDPDMANSLLDEMGLDKRGNDGFRLRPDGQTLSLAIAFPNAPFAGPADMIEIVKDNFDAVGIQTSIDAMERSLYETRLDANEIAFWSYNTDRSSLVMADPAWYLGRWAPPYIDWYNSKGKEGTAPPDGHPMYKLWEIWDVCQVEPDQTKRDALFMDMLKIVQENLWNIGVVGEQPALFITKNTLHNVPGGLIQDDPLRGIGLALPQQFYFS